MGYWRSFSSHFLICSLAESLIRLSSGRCLTLLCSLSHTQIALFCEAVGILSLQSVPMHTAALRRKLLRRTSCGPRTVWYPLLRVLCCAVTAAGCGWGRKKNHADEFAACFLHITLYARPAQ